MIIQIWLQWNARKITSHQLADLKIQTKLITMFGVWAILRSEGLLLTVLAETDGSLSVINSYNCFFHEQNIEQTMLTHALIDYFSFRAFSLNHWHPPLRSGNCMCNLLITHDYKKVVYDKKTMKQTKCMDGAAPSMMQQGCPVTTKNMKPFLILNELNN